MTNNQSDDNKKYTSNAGDFDRHADTVVRWGASHDGAHPWLHAKPLDDAIGQVLVPHCPSGRHGQRICCKTQNTNKTQHLASIYCTMILKNYCSPTYGTRFHEAYRSDLAYPIT